MKTLQELEADVKSLMLKLVKVRSQIKALQGDVADVTGATGEFDAAGTDTLTIVDGLVTAITPAE